MAKRSVTVVTSAARYSISSFATKILVEASFSFSIFNFAAPGSARMWVKISGESHVSFSVHRSARFILGLCLGYDYQFQFIPTDQ